MSFIAGLLCGASLVIALQLLRDELELPALSGDDFYMGPVNE